MQDFRDLKVWQSAMQLAEDVYRFTATLPVEEKFGLISQLRRAAVSVPSNIAEGNSRITKGEYVNFLGVARGSLAELQTQLILCKRLGWGPPDSIWSGVASTQRMLRALISSLK